ncbi:MAG: phosphate uptake regulator, PhoU [Candidatus Electronema aureum]|uniref:Phosphate-specific transport system accessory protein PhoU n=1 Tax=Candidatus Electronema aureum TaxID=2005002 RepID=A0A521FZ83_9BACT|nr:MAG: phosphate uptake regulator, PhoU [Candidatus Electronema aureum]
MILHRKIQKIKKRLLAIGAIVEEQVDLAVKSIVNRDSELAQKVIDGDVAIDLMEVDLEEECLKVLALHQPMAVDLRMIIAVLKINSDLERIGDLAVDATERAIALVNQAPIDFPFDFTTMSQAVQKMLKQSIDALINLDMDLAMQVCASDDAVDAMHAEVYRRVEEAILQHPEDIKQELTCLSVSRYLERIADHTTNIAEDVIYLIQGNIVRHQDTIY